MTTCLRCHPKPASLRPVGEQKAPAKTDLTRLQGSQTSSPTVRSRGAYQGDELKVAISPLVRSLPDCEV